MNNLVIEVCKHEKSWNKFVEASPQGTVFHRSEFLKAVKLNPTYYFVKKGEEIFGGFSVCKDEMGNSIQDVHFNPYFGSILFKNFSHYTPYKRQQKEFEITEFIVNEISLDEKVSFTMSPGFTDIRPFKWFNYHKESTHQYKCEINYTGILNIGEIDLDHYKNKLISTLRRRELKANTKCTIKEEKDYNILNTLHKKTFERQGIQRNKSEEDLLISITKSAIYHNYGKLLIAYIDELPVSATLFLYDSKASYYLFGANDPDFRNTSASTKLMYQNIVDTKEAGLQKIDFIGMNSPKRGFYKLTLGAEVVPYFKLKLRC